MSSNKEKEQVVGLTRTDRCNRLSGRLIANLSAEASADGHFGFQMEEMEEIKRYYVVGCNGRVS